MGATEDLVADMRGIFEEAQGQLPLAPELAARAQDNVARLRLLRPDDRIHAWSQSTARGIDDLAFCKFVYPFWAPVILEIFGVVKE